MKISDEISILVNDREANKGSFEFEVYKMFNVSMYDVFGNLNADSPTLIFLFTILKY